MTPGVAAQATPPTRPTPTSVVLVELFTSEGCSSCPPADQLLRAINGKRTEDGQWVVGISEHVTYWNRLGWTDPFSADAFTERQRSYAEHFQLDSVYTPQMVIGGREQIVGGSAADLQAAFRREMRYPITALQLISAQRVGDALAVHFRAGPVAGREPVDVMAAITDDTDLSHVARGENAGRALDHVAVARLLVRVATVQGETEESLQIPLPPSVAGAVQSGHHVVLFLQTRRLGPVLAAQTLPF